jgi:hypothetical protein
MSNYFFNLPDVIIKHIFEFDNTFASLFKSARFAKDIKLRSQTIKHTDEVVKKFIKTGLANNDTGTLFWHTIITDWGYIAMHEINGVGNGHYSETHHYLGKDFKIFLYPMEDTHQKYRILPLHIDESTIDLSDAVTFLKYTGYVCNEVQNESYMKKYKPTWNNIMETIDDVFSTEWIEYFHNNIRMELNAYNKPKGLYLHGLA